MTATALEVVGAFRPGRTGLGGERGREGPHEFIETTYVALDW
ncbi:MAG: hypothetical protein JWR58_4490 [Pseudonocardia sp.]|jgi:hypothetical protein|nr:hypothetical protein [Pseudonocardia sp.]